MSQPVLEFGIFRRIIRAKIHFSFVCFGWNVLTDVQFDAFPGILFIMSLINSFETWKTILHLILVDMLSVNVTFLISVM